MSGRNRRTVARYLFWCVALIYATIPLVTGADGPPDKPGCRTIDELFSAYKKATEDRDWRALFLLGTREKQDCDILMLVVHAATSQDATLRSLVEKHGAKWRQFDHAWTEADSQRFQHDYPVVAASVGKEVKDKPGLFVAAKSYGDKVDPTSSQVHELRNLVKHGATAVSEAVGSRTCIERQEDGRGNQIRKVSGSISWTEKLYFRQVDGLWYLAMDNEIASSEHGNTSSK